MSATPGVWLWISAVVSLIAGSLLVMNDSSAGWFLIILGIIDIGATARAGQGLAAPNRRMIGWGLVAATLLLVLVVLIAGAVFLLR